MRTGHPRTCDRTKQNINNMQGKSISGYTLQRHLGTGGMAEVWYAENKIGKKAAVKLLLPKLCDDDNVKSRFLTEAKVMVELDHPNIRQVYDYGDIDGRPAIVMEYLDGEDLKTRLKRGQRFKEVELERWWNQLVSALNYTHQKGIVHRDIKPGNIFVDSEGNIKLLDFGIAKVRESISKTQTGQKLGTLMYMSPEQVKDSKHIDYRTDVYSLAVTFVHLITGKRPYDSDTSSDFEISEQIVYKPLDLSGLPTAWRNFLSPYLNKAPEQRPRLRPFEAIVSPQTNDDDETGLGTPQSGETPVTVGRQPTAAPRQASPSQKGAGGGKPDPALYIALGFGIAVALIVIFAKPKPYDLTPFDTATTNGSANGHEYVDLGLPSGTLWATCNIGASKPEDYGNYYAWGETSTKNTYNWSTYKYANGDYDKLTKYSNKSDYGNNGFTDNQTALQTGDDPAASNWGGGWRTPTYDQWKELLEYTEDEWTGKGRKFTSKKNGQTLFLPAAGSRWGSELFGPDSRGNYWSRSLNTDRPYYAWNLGFGSDDCHVYRYYRDNGFSVRPVRQN